MNCNNLPCGCFIKTDGTMAICRTHALAGVKDGPRERPTHGDHTRPVTMPAEASARKERPVASGVLDYFPDAILAVAEVSYVGNAQHNPGEKLHWARGKSMDQDDTLIRHFLERGTRDTDGLRHTAKMAWRALALLQLEIEGEQ